MSPTLKRDVDPRSIAAPQARTAWIARIGLAGWCLVLFAAKLWVIGTYGNNTPFWDQWDAQATFLFGPYLSGHLPVDVLVSAHNEHRILWTRLLALLLLEL